MEQEQRNEYSRGFEHAVRNIVAALEKQAARESDDRVKIGLEIAARTANSYHGWMDPK